MRQLVSLVAYTITLSDVGVSVMVGVSVNVGVKVSVGVSVSVGVTVHVPVAAGGLVGGGTVSLPAPPTVDEVGILQARISIIRTMMGK